MSVSFPLWVMCYISKVLICLCCLYSEIQSLRWTFSVKVNWIPSMNKRRWRLWMYQNTFQTPESACYCMILPLSCHYSHTFLHIFLVFSLHLSHKYKYSHSEERWWHQCCSQTGESQSQLSPQPSSAGVSPVVMTEKHRYLHMHVVNVSKCFTSSVVCRIKDTENV